MSQSRANEYRACPVKKITLLHIITGLNQGGAETVLYRLLSHLDQKKYDITVISLIGEGYYSHKIKELGLGVIHLHLRRINFPLVVFQLLRIIKKLQPDLVQTWMYHANLLGAIAAKWSGCKQIIWGIRDSGGNLSLMTKIINTISARLSWSLPQSIITPSVKAMENHVKMGYQANKFRVIPNGIPIIDEGFKRVREEKKILTIGALGRCHPQKDYPTLLHAIALLNEAIKKRCHFIIAGRGVNESEELHSLRAKLQLENLTLLSAFDQPQEFYASLDVFVSSSAFGEAFPNVVAEAMSFGVPCIVTDVGDAAHIVADTGKVIPPANPAALMQALRDYVNLKNDERLALGQCAHERILTHFSLSKMLALYEKIYQELGEDKACVV